MSTPDLTLPLDPTGSAASNLVPNETHSIGPVGTRAFPLNYGLFFHDSLVITDLATNLPLIEGTQYYATQMDLDSSIECGQEVDAVVIIVDTTVSANVSVSYQALGGVNSINSAVVQSAITALDIDDGAIPWADVTNKLKDYPPGPHYHCAGDVYGLEYVVSAINRLAAAAIVGQGSAQAALQQYAEDVVAEMANFIAGIETILQDHFTCYNNPHVDTADLIGAYSEAQTTAAIALESTNRKAADAAITANLEAHIANHNDPHRVTPAQVGGYTAAQSDAAMTAMQTAVQAGITANEITENAHIANYNNPHQVTAAQIGTWTTPQITAALANSTTAIQNQVTAYQALVQAHEANTSNPHKDSVTTVGTWTQTAIQSGIVNPYTAHASNTANPHNDSYANIVTSGVDGSGVYSATTMNNSIDSAATSMAAQITTLNATIQSHTSNFSNPHADNVYNTGGAYSAAQLTYAINLLWEWNVGGSAAAAIAYLASITN